MPDSLKELLKFTIVVGFVILGVSLLVSDGDPVVFLELLKIFSVGCGAIMVGLYSLAFFLVLIDKKY